MTRPAVSAAVVDSVNSVLQSELATTADPDVRAHLLGVTEVLLHRAELEDLRPARRSALSSAVGPGADPYEGVAERATELARQRLDKDVLRALVAADLPELGSASSDEREAAATAAMDWLGKDTPSEISCDRVADYLAASGRGGLTVESVRQLSGGFSKTTLLLALRDGVGVQEVVLRQVPPGRDGSGLAAEFDVVRFAWEHGVPAPEPLWLEPLDNALGGPFFATRRVLGENLGDVFGPRPGVDPDVARGLAAALAVLHAVEPTDLARTPVAPMVTGEQVLARIDEQAEQVARAAEVDSGGYRPLNALLFAWLRTHVPEELPAPVLLHGDPGFHNLMVHEGKVQALLDWERARLGDAAQDLSYVRPHVTRVLPWQDFLEAYGAAGGRPPDERHLRYYAVWHDTWRYAGAYRGRARLLTGRRSVLDGVIGLLHAPRFLHSALSTAFEVDL